MTEECTGQLAANAGRCRELLTEQAAAQIAAFLVKQQNADGGFRGRGSASDLYYTHFALEALAALGRSIPLIEELRVFLVRCAHNDDVDLPHLACLLRCWRAIGNDPPRELLDRVEQYRAPDGGYHWRKGAPTASPSACYLAVLAYEAAGMPLPNCDRVIHSLHSAPLTNTPTVAALSVLLTHLEGGASGFLANWLMARAAKTGGFAPSPRVQVPDLLSTATALHALKVSEQPLGLVRQASLEFVRGLWMENGGFRGTSEDRTADCEYTYYALLALGCLA